MIKKTHIQNLFFQLQLFLLFTFLLIGCSISKDNKINHDKKYNIKIICDRKNYKKNNIVVSLVPVVEAFEKRNKL